MDKDFDQKFRSLPPHIQEWMAEESTDINGEIAENHQLGPEDTGRMVWVISRTIVGGIKLEDFHNKLKENLSSLEEETIKKIAIDIAIKRFWPIRDLLEETEVLIKDLGGTVPENDELYKGKYDKLTDRHASETERKNESLLATDDSQSDNNEIVYVGIGEILEKHPEMQDQFITSKPIKLKTKETEVGATYSNWTQDYRERIGAPPHSTIERTEYLFKSDNAKNLDNSERTILGNVLKAYDEGGKLPIDATSGKLILSELFHQHTVATPPVPKKIDLPAEQLPNNIIDLRNKQ